MLDTPPSRKALLAAFEAASPIRAFALFSADVLLFAAGTALALMPDSVLLKLLGSLLLTAATVRLFLIGHDACHGSFFSQQILNDVIGRIAFLPSLTAFSLWDVGHNVAHHGFNNLKNRDQVWAPFSQAEYDALPRSRQWLERVYRSGYGFGAYYLLELWWRKLYFASQREIGSSRRKYKTDSLIVTAWAILWVTGTVLAARSTHQSVALLLLTAIVLPFLAWNWIMGFVVFVHHTHPTIAWFQKRQEWQRCRAYLTATANVRFPFHLDRLMHNIMEHNAHHVNPRIPLFRLRRAQQLLAEHQGGEIRSYRLNWASYTDAVRRCKLYDFPGHRWLDFSGRVTSAVTVTAPLATAAVPAAATT